MTYRCRQPSQLGVQNGPTLRKRQHHAPATQTAQKGSALRIDVPQAHTLLELAEWKVGGVRACKWNHDHEATISCQPVCRQTAQLVPVGVLFLDARKLAPFANWVHGRGFWCLLVMDPNRSCKGRKQNAFPCFSQQFDWRRRQPPATTGFNHEHTDTLTLPTS